jgi:LSD1 subclass zinc finger protein
VYGHVLCGGCSIMLMYPLGAQSVKCSVCHHVTGVSQHQPWQGLGGGGGGGGSAGGGGGGAGGSGGPPRQQGAPKPPTQTVVVEQPPTVDEQGNEVPNIAVGVQEDPRK